MANPPLHYSSDPPEIAPSGDLPEVATAQGLHSATLEPYDGLHLASELSPYPKNQAWNSAGYTPEDTIVREQGWDKAVREPGGDKIVREEVEDKILHEPHKGLFGWSRRTTWIVAVIVVLAIIAIVVGVTVGVLTSSNGDDGDGNGDGHGAADGSADTTSTTAPVPAPTSSDVNTAFGTPTAFPDSARASDSACYGETCPSVLAVTQPDPDESTILLFGRGAGGEYWYRESDGEGWMSDWESIGGAFLSQPAVISVSRGRIDVFGVWESDMTMRTKTYSRGTWEVDWRSLAGRCYSPPTLCSRGEGRISVFTLSSEHELAWKTLNAGEWSPEASSGWDRAVTGFVGSSPWLLCDPDRADVVAYGQDESPYQLMVKRQNGTNFGYWEQLGGDFQGDPVAVYARSDRTDFFGIGTDLEMYHGSWPNEMPTVLTDDEAQSLGGEFESVAGVLVTGTSRVDVVAVGTDGRLKQKAMIDDAWADDWEDLGGFLSSAPLVWRLSDNRVAVFALGQDGEVIHGLWEVDEGAAWRNGQWFVDGGNFTTSWHRSGPA
ncbi:hypothetical protein S40285_04404 [Stachybotrys chlorohalonatus IBT 40285]|uniref:PLL-like beta propeller domain-containing protein n=1 Tax=Stachybotrys chlorohalonatus (strain IBT 40285) TaxID=1283841 RepID=A0A084R1Y1_STAC4|nr:hypothetical protein S40285_04404 [Stachybotrys chlorohalonata IBT 40285]